jgi:hypothetical protein
MSFSGVRDAAGDETHVGPGGLLRTAGAQDGSVQEPRTARQPTGDDAVDQVLGQLDAATDEPLDIQIEVGEQVHRVLLGRLADLGKE